MFSFSRTLSIRRDANAEDDGKPARFMAATEYQLRDAAAWAVARGQ